MSNECVLVGGGDVDPSALQSIAAGAALRIGVDGGALALESVDCLPEWVVGDFDSLGEASLARLRGLGVRVKEYPREKNETDLELALELAAGLAASGVAIFGATGTRLDHTMANFGLLLYAAELGLPATIHAPGQQVRLLRGGQRMSLAGWPGRAVSLIPLTPDVRGISTEGLLYPLKGETLRIGHARGVHNEITREQAGITVAEGDLLVFEFDLEPA